MTPTCPITYGENVNVAVHDEVSAWFTELQVRNDVWFLSIGSYRIVLYASFVEEFGYVGRCLSCVSRWVGAPSGDQSSQKVCDRVLVHLDSFQQLLLCRQAKSDKVYTKGLKQ